MDLFKALSLSLGEVEEPVVTRYHLGVILHHLYVTKSYKGEPLKQLQREFARSTEFSRVLVKLQDHGILTSHPDFPERVFRILGRKENAPEEVACSVDPFCYVSHLSAMAHHGLTDRLPTTLFLSSPDSQDWQAEAQKRMGKDLGADFDSYQQEGMPLLIRLQMKKIGRVPVHRVSSIRWGAYTNVRGKTLRVSSIGRTFLDMLRMPELCGGMHHVVETFEEHAAVYLPLITDEIDRHGGSIDKVRAGYILQERLGLRNETIEGWKQFAQRGGSRKLDASAEYRPAWSDTWLLSLNLD